MGERLKHFLLTVCDRRTYVVWIFTLAAVFLVFQIPYLFIVDPGTPLFVVSVLNVIGLSAFTSASGATLWYCRQHR
jgi:cell division protein FtsW (lipid II flippase)